MSTDVPVHHYTCSVCFFCFGITCTMAFQLIYRGTYTQIHPKANLPVYVHASLSSKDLPVTTTTCVHAHRSTCSWPYLFIFILSFGLTVNIYPSTFLLFYMHIDVPVHHYTCSVCFFFFSITCTMTFQLICWGMYTQIHPKINLFIFMLLLCLRTKTYLTPLVCLPWNVPIHNPTCSFSYFYSIRLTAKICLSTFLLLYISTDISVHHYTCTVYFFLFGITGTVTFPLIC